MPLIIPAADVQNITWNDLADRMNQVDSLANGAGKRLNMQTDGAGNVTLSANTHIPLVSSSGPQLAATNFMKGVLERTLGAEAGPTIAAAGLPANGPWPGNCAAVLNPHVQAMDQALQTVMANAKWPHLMAQNNQPPVHPGLTTQGVAQVLTAPGSNVRVADSGSGAAILAFSGLEQSGGMVVKSEEPGKIGAAAMISNLGRELQAATGNGLPFDFVTFETVNVSPADQQAVLAAYDAAIPQLQDRVTNGGLVDEELADAELALEAAQRARAGVAAGTLATGRMELVPDSVQLNRLPLPDKVALFKSPEFAQKIGQAIAVCPMFGLNDHLGEATTNNASNFMINPNTGVLTAIDYSARVNGPGHDMPYGNTLLAGRVNAMQTAVNDNNVNCQAIDLAMDQFFLAGHKDSFFTSAQEVNAVSANDITAFRQNVLAGMGQGLNFVRQNIAQFEQGYQNVADDMGIADQNRRPFATRAQMENIANTLGVAANLPGLPEAWVDVDLDNLDDDVPAVHLGDGAGDDTTTHSTSDDTTTHSTSDDTTTHSTSDDTTTLSAVDDSLGVGSNIIVIPAKNEVAVPAIEESGPSQPQKMQKKKSLKDDPDYTGYGSTTTTTTTTPKVTTPRNSSGYSSG